MRSARSNARTPFLVAITCRCRNATAPIRAVNSCQLSDKNLSINFPLLSLCYKYTVDSGCVCTNFPVQTNYNCNFSLNSDLNDINGSLKINIPLVVKFIDDTKITSQNPKYFADLQSGVFVYFLVCPTGESVFGFSFGENNGSYFGCQILTSGFDMDIKIRNCAWATKWSEWRTL